MTSSLVGSEMCIRDRAGHERAAMRSLPAMDEHAPGLPLHELKSPQRPDCLLYTSDAADDM
eukprot:8753537-Prorocentrum_lima.AAC.1